MRFLTTSLVAVLAALAITACSSSSSSADNSSSSATSSASDNSGAMSSSDNSGAMSSSDNSGASSAASGGSGGSADTLPSYPGAKTEAAGSSSMAMGGGAAMGKVMSTADSFDKVVAWYTKNLPAGVTSTKTDTPVKAAVFTMNPGGSNQQSVSITVSGGKTMITVASVKKP